MTWYSEHLQKAFYVCVSVANSISIWWIVFVSSLSHFSPVLCLCSSTFTWILDVAAFDCMRLLPFFVLLPYYRCKCALTIHNGALFISLYNHPYTAYSERRTPYRCMLLAFGISRQAKKTFKLWFKINHFQNCYNTFKISFTMCLVVVALTATEYDIPYFVFRISKFFTVSIKSKPNFISKFARFEFRYPLLSNTRLHTLTE